MEVSLYELFDLPFLADMLPDDWGDGWPNVWLGVTAENQEMANIRIPLLLEHAAAVRFVSAEPLLGPVNLTEAMYGPDYHGMSCFGFTDGFGYEACLQWIIAGGESGPDNREMKEEWALDLQDQCKDAEAPFFFKQWSGLNPSKDPRGNLLDGVKYEELPCQST